jgi:hypothetical protein
MRAFYLTTLSVVMVAGCSETTSTPLPNPPENVTASLVDRATVRVAWAARPPAENIVSYGIYRDGKKIGTTATTSFEDSSPPENKTHAYAVASQSSDGLISELSTPSTILAPDATSPRVLATVPARGEVNINPNPIVQVVFSEPLNVGSVDNNSLIVKISSSGAAISGAASYLPSTNTIQWQPTASIGAEQRVIVSVGPGVRDTAGNAVKQSFDFDFTIREGIPPTIVSYFPGEGGTISVYARPTITFSEPVQRPCCFGLGEIGGNEGVIMGASLDATQRVVTLTPVTRFKPGSTYHLRMDRPPLDLVGNPMVGAVSLTYTYSNDFSLTKVVSTSPADGATAITPNSPKLTVAFDHPLIAPVGYDASFDLRTRDGAIVSGGYFIYDLYASTLTYNAPQLQPGTSYVISLKQTYAPPGGAPVEESYSWSFTTGN